MDISNIKLINRALNAFFLSVLLLVLSISCISNEGNDIELKLSKTDFEEYSFNEIIKDYYTVQLETTTDNLLGNIIRLYVSGSRIFAWDLGQNIVFIFDRQGKYIGKLDKSGGGPGEYMQINDFQLSVSQDEMIVYNGIGQGLLYYDQNGKYLRSRKVFGDLNFMNRLEMQDGCVAFYFDRRDTKEIAEKYQIAILGKDSLLRGFIPSRKQSTLMGTLKPNLIRNSGGETYYYPPFWHQVYQLNDSTIDLVADLNFGERQIPVDFHDRAFQFSDFKRELMESDAYSFIYGSAQVSNEYLALPISNKDWKVNGVVFKSLSGEKNYFVSRIKLDDNKYISPYPRASYQNYFVNILDEQDVAITGVASKIAESKNPELVFYQLN